MSPFAEGEVVMVIRAASSLCSVAFGSALALGALASGIAATGCATASGPAVSMTTTQSATAEAKPHTTMALLAPVHAEEDDAEDNPRGVLVVGDDLVRSCSSLRAMKAPKDEAMAWVRILKSVAHCVNNGELRERSLVLHGPTRPQVIVKYMLSRVGIKEDRVELTTGDGQSTCADDCDPADMRVEIGIAGSKETALAQTL